MTDYSKNIPTYNAHVIDLLKRATELHQNNELTKASEIYKQVLEIQPQNFDALHILGVISYQNKNFSLAVELITKAIKIDPLNHGAYSNHGIALKGLRLLEEALISFNHAIELNPSIAGYYFNKANAQKELKQYEAAISSYKKAIELNPNFPLAISGQAEAIKEYLTQGKTLHQQGKLSEAEDIYKKILEVSPNHADSLHLLGVIESQCGRQLAATELIRKAIAIDSSIAVYYSNLAHVFHAIKKYESALDCYERAILLQPQNAENYFNKGNVLKEIENFDLALKSYDTSISLNPGYAEAYCNRGELLRVIGDLESALVSLDRAIELRSDSQISYINKGAVLQDLRQFDEALKIYETIIKLNPDHEVAYAHQGVALQQLKKFDLALNSYEKAIAIKPDPPTYFHRGYLLLQLGQLDAALKSYDECIALEPDYPYLLGMRQHLRMKGCDWSDFDAVILNIRKKIHINKKVITPFPALALPVNIDELFQATKLHSSDKNFYKQSLGKIDKPLIKSKIRIGYYSADFHNHATTQLMAELFERHCKDKFELIAFSYGPNINDAMRNRVAQAFDAFANVTNMSDIAVAKLSRDYGIDIAVDLKGFTEDARLGIFSYRAAPIQVSYLGFPGTLGVDYIDYLIADSTLIPEDSQKYYSEKIVYLPHSYQVNDRKRIISEKQFTKLEMGLPKDAFVFCSFNNNYKITPTVFDCWMKILKTVDKSVLWLLEDNDTAALNLRKEAVLRGIDPNRLVFAKRMKLPEHLSRHKLADLFLDTYPYNAHTTASDALWAGLPLLTCMGKSFPSRVAASLLNAIGLSELVTTEQKDYEALAIELATNPVKLLSLKDKLENNKLITPLFDSAKFVINIESAYSTIYDRYHNDLQPEHIYIC